MAILNNNPLVGASGNQGGYNINNSLRFRSSASAYLNRTPASAGNRRTWTWSGWVKRGQISIANNGIFSAGTSFGVNNNNLETISFPAGDTLEIASEVSGVAQYRLITTQVFRDPSAWYHVVVAIDTTQATASNRIKIYINGTQVTAFSTSSYPAQNYDCWANSTNAHRIGSRASPDFDGYMADVNFIDGSAKTPSDFGETDTTTGVWKPKAYSGTYGTNGFYLKFSDIATTSGSNAGLGKDFSGNSNYWTTNNISVTSGTTYDAMTDSPTNTSATVANYAVLNPLNKDSGITVTQANLQATGSVGSVNRTIFSTMSIPSSQKIYFEIVAVTGSSVGNYFAVGIAPSTLSLSALVGITGSFSIESNQATDSYKRISGTGTSYGAGTNFATNDIVQVAIDQANGKIWFGKNNTWFDSGNPSAGTNPATSTVSTSTEYFPAATFYENGPTLAFNFGQRPFAYTPPTGFVALNTYNLPTPTILQGNKYMDATLYTGTGSSLNVTGVNFQPDFVWIKERSGVADHGLYDAIRGVQKQLESNTTTDETTETTGLTAFNSNGFTVGALAQLNTNTDTYVAWGWKETATSGFDIVTYTGNGSNRTISHSLGVAPRMIIVKARTTASTDQGWAVYHASNTTAPETDYLLLNSSAATADLDTVWNDTVPTSSVFSVGTNALVNTNNDTYVAYCFAEISGFSRFGGYTGNGSADGTFVYTGFRPKYILIKVSSAVEDWMIFDSVRGTTNANGIFLRADTSDTGGSDVPVDFLSNGFKLRSTALATNSSGNTYIYAAFAENPFKNALAR